VLRLDDALEHIVDWAKQRQAAADVRKLYSSPDPSLSKIDRDKLNHAKLT
jgi:hypothetical protein